MNIRYVLCPKCHGIEEKNCVRCKGEGRIDIKEEITKNIVRKGIIKIELN